MAQREKLSDSLFYFWMRHLRSERYVLRREDLEGFDVDVQIKTVRPLTAADLEIINQITWPDVDVEHQASRADRATLDAVAKALDLVLEPEECETVIGDLAEAYSRRLHDPAHAKRWLWAQAFWIAINRGIDLVGRVRKAWAGK